MLPILFFIVLCVNIVGGTRTSNSHSLGKKVVAHVKLGSALRGTRLIVAEPEEALGGSERSSNNTLNNNSRGVNLVVIVRIHKPTQSMIDRMGEFQNDLLQSLPNSMFIISWDTSGLQYIEKSTIAKSIQARVPSAWLQTYNFDQVKKAYPMLKTMNFADHRVGGWSYHAECILTTMSWAKTQRPIDASSYVWVVEDDVGICGGISRFVQEYSTDHSDLLAANPPVQVTELSEWVNQWYSTSLFMSKYGDKRFYASEFVQRFSMRLLDQLDKLSSAGITAWSEMYVPTVCENDGFICSSVAPRNVFSGHIAWDSWVSKQEWDQMCPTSAQGMTPRFAHTLKY